MNYVGESKPSSGLSLSVSGGKIKIRSIRSNSSAEDAGLSVNDEVIGFEGVRVDKNMLEAFLAGLNVGDKVSILYAREDQLYSTYMTMKSYEKPRYNYKIIEGNGQKSKLFNYWLR